MLQIAWERGLDLDTYNVEDFSEKGMFDGFGNRIQKPTCGYFLFGDTSCRACSPPSTCEPSGCVM